MAYSRNDAISAIVNYKQLWNEANTAGNEADKKKAATLAQNIYGQMRANGDSSIADELSASDYAASQNVLKKYQQSQAATTSYNRDNAINDIVDYKKQWADADAAGDEIGKQYAANSAGSVYSAMMANGDTNIADELKASNYTQAQALSDKWHQLDKTSTRPYFYSLGQKYGMTQEQVDALIGWDAKTGEVSFGGQNLGKPDYLSDGASYWSDTSVLDNAFNDYISRSGTTRTTDQLIGQNNDEINQKVNQLWGLQTNDHNDLTNKYKEEYDFIANTNPFTTDTAKAILAKYDLSGLQARDNAVAGGGASNGGNIDSYAAANALRQQSALINQGQMAVLDAHQQRIDNARSILESLGVSQQNSYTGMQNTIGVQQEEAQRLFENQENARQFDATNDTERYRIDKNLEGIKDTNASNLEGTKYTSDNQLAGIKDTNASNLEGTKYTADKESETRIHESNNTLAGIKDTNASNVELGQIESNTRIHESDNQLASDKYVTDKTTNADIHKSDNELEGTKYVADKEADTSKYVADAESDTSKYVVDNGGTKPTLTASQATTAIKNGEISEDVISAYNYYYGTDYTVDNPPKVGDQTVTELLDDGNSNNGGNAAEGWTTFTGYFTDEKVKKFLNEQLKPYYDSGRELNEEVLEKLIVGSDVLDSNSTDYDIDVEDAKAICNALGLDDSWVNKYTNRTWFNSGKGMKLAE